MVFEGPALSSHGLKLPETEIEVVHGETLRTEAFPDLEGWEREAYETMLSDQLADDDLIGGILGLA